VALAGQSQVVVISLGTADGIEPGHVLAILKAGRYFHDKSDPSEREGRATKIIAYYHTGITDKERLIAVIKRMQH